MPRQSLAVESTCYGTTKNGRLEHAVALPAKGNHFITYGKVLKIAARTFVAARFALSYLMLTTGSKPSSRERFLNTANPDLKMAGSSSRTKPIRLGYRWIFSFPD
ncbi:MAG: hypothetical protein JSU88_05075 [Nitrospinaceae bacterium]|nr:MAG: hypothetical protein JSU88_05075 [Nitrospinaceae bacterium]